MLIEGKKELNFLKRAGAEEGDFNFIDLPSGILAPTQKPDGTSEYDFVLDNYLAGDGGQIHPLRRHDKQLQDPEKVKQVMQIWTEQFSEVYQNFATFSQMINGINTTIQQREEFNKLRAYYVDTINSIYYGMKTAELKLIKCNNIVWQIGDSMKDDLKLDMRFVSKLMMADSLLLDALNAQKEQLKETVKWARKTNSPFLARFAQVVESAEQIIAAILELTSTFIDIVDELYNEVIELEGMIGSSEYEEPQMSKAARLFRTAQVDDPSAMPPPIPDMPQGQSQPPVSPFQIQGPAGMGMGGIPKPLPIPDEYQKLKFPQITKMPTDNWGLILLAGQNQKLININYTKTAGVEEGVTKTYVVEPYSFRMKRGRYFFFGFDVNDSHIKNFAYRAINSVEILNDSFSPQWTVELSYLG